jgi:cation transport regulator ChaC
MVPAPPNQSERTFGIVYEIANEQRDSVLAYLDDREKVRQSLS